MQHYGNNPDNEGNAPQYTPYMSQDPYGYNNGLSVALQLIRDALSGETEDRMFYEYLISIAPSEEEKRIIESIRDDEMRHYSMFRQLYYELTGQMPTIAQEPTFEKPASYCDGIKRALFGEQNAVRKYRRILFALQDRRQINMLTEIITDEIRHGILYSYIYSKNGCDV
ncbi:MAG: ferritin-like domain-containing protein [Bacillota bacterium]|nr:ferritin-like domain-containing protein [Bacillota bacterium]